MAKILMVEDSAQLREAVSDFFKNRSGGTLTVETAADGDEGMNAVMNNTYDLVILDIMLPGPSGYMICKKLREKSDCPIVFLTALGTEDKTNTWSNRFRSWSFTPSVSSLWTER